MSSLAAALAAQKPVGKGTRCGVGNVLDQLDDIDRKALLNALESDMFSTDISRALYSEGHKVGGSTIARHRKQECNCDRR